MNKQPPSILIIKSANTELSKVEKFIRAIFSYYNFSDKCFNAVYLCISEAITNSIVHGNKEDCRKKVELSVDCIT
ncbi:MAG TPA: ATP-binding protein, partial [Draconibacterium sp.]|nr:ATP-binding protein [Draconibacterium sp.]